MARALLIAEKPSLMREVQAVYKTMNYPDQIDFKCFRGHTMTLYAPADYTKDWEKWDLNTSQPSCGLDVPKYNSFSELTCNVRPP